MASGRLHPDPELRRLHRGRILVGGWPIRLIRLGPGAARHVDAWCAGAPAPGHGRPRALARRLLEAGMLHPRPCRRPSGGPSRSDVTVVVPVRDRAAALSRCLDGLARTWMTLVVDDGSVDPSAVAAVATAAGARCVRRDVGGGPAAARNTGLAAVTTPLVAFIDSDCVPHTDWIGPLLPYFADPVVGVVAPRVVGQHAEPGVLAAYEAACSALDMGERESIVRPGSRVPYVPTAALVARRAAAAVGFDEGLSVGEDVDFVWRMTAAGWHVRYEPSVTVAHRHRLDLASWFGRRLAYGTSAAPLARHHPGLLPAASMPGQTAAAWLLLACGRPLPGLSLAGAATVLAARRLARRGSGLWPLALRLAAAGTLRSGEQMGNAVRRGWWPVLAPLAVVSRRLRLALAAACLAPPLAEWARKTPDIGPLPYLGLRLLDDLAYSLGVWAGCYRQRTLQPLVAHFWWRSSSE